MVVNEFELPAGHHQAGKFEARIGRVAGNRCAHPTAAPRNRCRHGSADAVAWRHRNLDRDCGSLRRYLYLGTYPSEEEAAQAYDRAAIKFRGKKVRPDFDPYDPLCRFLLWPPIPIGAHSLEPH